MKCIEDKCVEKQMQCSICKELVLYPQTAQIPKYGSQNNIDRNQIDLSVPNFVKKEFSNQEGPYRDNPLFEIALQEMPSLEAKIFEHYQLSPSDVKPTTDLSKKLENAPQTSAIILPSPGQIEEPWYLVLYLYCNFFLL